MAERGGCGDGGRWRRGNGGVAGCAGACRLRRLCSGAAGGGCWRRAEEVRFATTMAARPSRAERARPARRRPVRPARFPFSTPLFVRRAGAVAGAAARALMPAACGRCGLCRRWRNRLWRGRTWRCAGRRRGHRALRSGRGFRRRAISVALGGGGRAVTGRPRARKPRGRLGGPERNRRLLARLGGLARGRRWRRRRFGFARRGGGADGGDATADGAGEGAAAGAVATGGAGDVADGTLSFAALVRPRWRVARRRVRHGRLFGPELATPPAAPASQPAGLRHRGRRGRRLSAETAGGS